MLHPELERLQSNYSNVLDENEAGNISLDDALHAVQAMSVIDGNGFVWTIDSSTGAFARARPGEEPEIADFSAFASAQLNNIPAARTDTDLMTPPPRQQRQSIEADEPMRLSGRGSKAPGGRHLEDDDAPKRRLSKKTKSLDSAEESFLNRFFPPESFVGGLLVNHRRTVIVATACIALVGLVIVLKPSSQEVPAAGPGGLVPVEQSIETVPGNPNEVPLPTLVDVPVETAAPDLGTAEPAPSAPVEQLPTVDNQFAVLQSMVSADRASVAAAVVTPGTDRDVALRTAEYAGYAATSITITVTGPAAIADDETVVSVLQLIDQVSGEVLGSATAQWAAGPNGWQLATYPTFG